MGRKGRAEMEGCKTIFRGDKGRERLREICLIGPVRTGWGGGGADGKKTYQNGKRKRIMDL